MDIKGKVHLMFEQSGVFKNEFKKLGYNAFCYDIQDEFGETDFKVDLFSEIEKGYNNEPSIFDSITKDDLIMAFFPCIYFCDNNVLYFTGEHINYKHWKMDKSQVIKSIIQRSRDRQKFYELLLKLFEICTDRGLRLIFENPYSATHYLHNNFPFTPSVIDRNRRLRGDYFKKPTQYYFVNCEPTNIRTIQDDKPHRTICGLTGRNGGGLCSETRSMISPDYARNFICDFILGKKQKTTELTLFG